MGGVQVPEGAPEQEPVAKKPKQGNANALFAVAALALVALSAVLIGVLPDWGGDDNKVENNNNTPETQAELYYHQGPFDVKVSLFSQNITTGYASEEEVKEDLKQLAKSFLNVGIKDGAYNKRVFDLDGDMVGAPTAGEDQEDAGDDGGDEEGDDATDYDTNNQEHNVDRADFTKSDGSFVYAAFGDHILVWQVEDLEVVSQVQMPPIEVDGNNQYPEGDPFMDAEDYWWRPQPRIEALLLEGTRLTAVVSGYGVEHTASLEESPVFNEYYATHIRVYETNNGILQLVSTTDIQGGYRNAYSVGQNVHVVTQAAINTWAHLVEPVQRWQPRFEGMDDDKYIEEAVKYADEHLIDPFVSKLYDALEFVDLARITMFVDGLSPDGDLSDKVFQGGLPQSLTQVVSFDMQAGEVPAGEEPDELQVHMAGTLQTGSWGHVYATEGMIIVADQGWSWWGWGEGEKTYLLGFRLDGATSTHSVTGAVEGSILNPYSLDFVNQGGVEYLRIATTQNFWWNWWGDEMAIDTIAITEEDAVVGSDGSSSNTGSGEGEPEEEPAEEPVEDGDVKVDENGNEKPDGDADEEEPVPVPESSTLNQIIVLKLPDGNPGEQVFEHVGNVTLGKPNERFTTLRFFDEFAYAVTFERTDPFYVVDLSVPEEPEEVGALEVEGFSEYLHPIDNDNHYLVAVGQHADENGRVLGLQISLFDASDPSNPALLNRYIVEEKDNQWSSSGVSWDPRAFRFLKLGERQGKLIIPITINGWTEVGEGEKSEPFNFQGFSVFDITNDVITKDFDIDHSSQDLSMPDGCYNYGWLAERSMVFSGDAMTMQGYTVVNTDLSNGKVLETLNVNELQLGCQE